MGGTIVDLTQLPMLTSAQLEAYAAALLTEIDGIRLQLADQTRKEDAPSLREYQTWRKNATSAYNKKLAQYRALKAEVKRRNTYAADFLLAAAAGELPTLTEASTDFDALVACYGLLKSLARRAPELFRNDGDEFRLIDVVGNRIRYRLREATWEEEAV